ncbi:hypothetical protein BGX31_001183 [Mortierella sp. GBA43]|nr:hypothetical protein BGX31_001183 [Mortierella sp. GBA43]
MFSRCIIPAPKAVLLPCQVLELTTILLDGANKTTDHDVLLVLCHQAEAALSRIKRRIKKIAASTDSRDQALRKRIASTYCELGRLMDTRHCREEAEALYLKARKLDGRARDSGPSTIPPGVGSTVQSTKDATLLIPVTPSILSNRDTTLVPSNTPTIQPTKDAISLTSDTSPAQSSKNVTTAASDVQIVESIKDTTPLIPNTSPADSDANLSTYQEIANNSAAIPDYIFPNDVRPPTIPFTLPTPGSRLEDTLQLAFCLALLQGSYDPGDKLDQVTRDWLQVTKNDQDEKERLKTLVTNTIRAFIRDELKDANAIAEIMHLASVLDSNDYRHLLKEFYSGIDQSGLLDVYQLDGLAQLIQGADSGVLQADDLVKVLELLSARLRDTHKQSLEYLYQLTVAVSYVLDAMADADVKGLSRENLHGPLLTYLGELKESRDPYLVYQAAYAYQALLCVPDDETLWQATLRRTGKIVKGTSGLVTAVKALDLNGFMNGLKDIQDGIAGVSKVAQIVKDAYEGATTLVSSGQGFLKCLKEGLSFSHKCAWYTALRGTDALVRDGQFSEFKMIVCQAPCRCDMAFQWGVCERLGNIAAKSTLDDTTRQSAISMLGEIYQNDAEWGQQATIKQWILKILMQLSSGSGNVAQFSNKLLEDLQNNGDVMKKKLYQECRGSRLGVNPLKSAIPALGSSSLLDRVQERLDVEGAVRQLRTQRSNERGNGVYIPPQAKDSLQAGDEGRFPLMEKVQEFITGDKKVFLLLGDSGAGKSTFNRELEFQLWQTYNKTDPIPLHVNLPTIDKPEHDMIAKQLRKAEFNERQIRELKLHRHFILICDGYDESQLTRNLYTSNRLNQPGEWRAKMVISCRSEYIGVDYRARFQPGDRNQRYGSVLFQEAVIAPFSMDQVQDYIDQYVSINRPLWKADAYKKELDHIPSLKELVRNPFLMSLSLEVLPRMVDLGCAVSNIHITRVALYDQFIDHWLERGKKRLSEKSLGPNARAAFESLSDEGFTQNGINFLKRLCKAIYKEQGGQPVVRYSRYNDEGSWKEAFFSRDDEKQLLREACPLVRNGNQHRFIHRTLLEYGVALAVFDPQYWKERTAQELASSRRGSTSSIWSYDSHFQAEDVPATNQQEPDINSPLAWRYFVNEPSIVQFLEERVRQEPLFKKQLSI